jgi:hypothetical protein
MAKRSSGLGCFLLIIGLGFLGMIIKAIDSVSPIIWGFMAIVFICSVLAYSTYKEKKKNEAIEIENEAIEARKLELFLKYRSKEIVERIMVHSVWQDQTEEQVIDSIGKPHATDLELTKKKNVQVWKYYKHGNYYKLKVTVENGVVVGIEKKDS